MKRNVSDLLDALHVQDVKIENSTPLSSQRIKELTMGKVNGKYKRKRSLGFKLLVAAAIIASLSMTAFAAEEIFNVGDIIRMQFRERISDSQVEVINELGGSFQPATQTSEGTTVTLAAAYGDAYMLHLYLQVEAPADVVLPDDILYEFCDWNAIDYSDPDCWENLEPGEGAPYESISRSVEIEPLPDADSTDNKKDFHVLIHGQPGTECKFNDGYTKYFNMTGIYEQVPDVDEDTDGFVQLAPGNFSFDVGLVNEVETVELDVEGLIYGGHKTRTWTHDSECLELCTEKLTGETDSETGLPIHSEEWNYEVTVKKAAISSLSMEWEVEYAVDNEQMNFGLAFQVVLKDGTMVEKLVGGMGNFYGDNESNGMTYFTEPIDLSEVDYILIGDPDVGETYKIYLPETNG